MLLRRRRRRRASRRLGKPIGIGLGVLLAALVVGWMVTRAPSPQAELERAQAAMARGDIDVAVIHLKNTLQARPGEPEARLLLGSVLLDQGEVQAAGIELEKAEEANADRVRLVPLLARHAMLAGEPRKVILRYADTWLEDPAADAALRTWVGAASAELDDVRQARLEIEAALRTVPGHPPARILAIRLQAREGDADGALQALDALLADSPSVAEAWRLKGDLLANARAEPSTIAAAYREAVRLHPGDIAAHTGLIQHHLSLGQLDAAQAQWQQMHAARPAHIQTAYHQALIAYERQDFAQARDIAEQLLKELPNSSRALQLAGAAEFELKSYIKAEAHLRRALAEPGATPVTRRMLAQIYLQSGEPARALAAVQALLAQNPPDAQALALAGEAALRNGQPQRARELFAAAAQADPGQSRSQTMLALMRIREGNTAAGFDALRRLAEADTEGATDVAIVRTHLQRREFDQALDAAETLHRKLPQRAFPLQLRALVQLARNDVTAARASFEQALQREPGFYPAAAMLAAIDSAEGKPDAARERFEAVLAADPKNLRARLALAELRGRAGAGADEVAALLAEAVQTAPDQAEPRVALLEHHLAQRNPRAALNVANEALAHLPGHPQLIEALGRAHAAAGDLRQAGETFVQLRNAMPGSPVPWQRQAEVQIAQRDLNGATASLRRAIELAPDLTAVRLRLAEVQLAAGANREAMQTVRALIGLRPNLAAAHTAEGGIHASRQAWPEAVAAFRRSLALEPDSGVAARLHAALLAAQQEREATALQQRWRADHPADGQFLFLLGSDAVLRGRLEDAAALFAATIEVTPNHAAALNNLAWLSLRLGRPGAMPLAQRANELQPGQPAYLDTLSTAHEAAGDMAQAIALQQQALTLAPESHPLRLRLAKLHLKAGQREAAHAELRRLAELGPGFAHHAEVQALLAGR